MNFAPQKHIVKSHIEICALAEGPTKVKLVAVSPGGCDKLKLSHAWIEYFLILQENFVAVMFCL